MRHALLLALLLLISCADTVPSRTPPSPASLPVANPTIIAGMSTLGAWDARPDTPVIRRPIPVVRVPYEDIRRYRTGQRIDSLIQPTGTWFAPAVHAGQIVGAVWADSTGAIRSFQVITPGTLTLHPSYTDPAAEPALINLEPIGYVLLLRRAGDERLALLYQERPSFYPALQRVAGQEVTPDIMMQALNEAIEQRCTVWWVFKQC